MIERKTLHEIIVKMAGQNVDSVNFALSSQRNYPFHPKGHAIEDYSRTQIRMVEKDMKIYAYKTSNELFEEEL